MMDAKKICFITCVSNNDIYVESLKFISSLKIPEGYKVDFIKIENAESITAGYNKAMKSSDAKYKVYLHQDVFIINKNFISDVLNIFKSNDKIGILGVAGANTIPTNGVWWDSIHRFGKIYENHSGIMKLLDFDNIESKYQEVKALDGLIMITQYDVEWREDLFTGWHFYDLSQCVEFSLRGFKVVIPKQDEPWCIHDCGFVETTGDYIKYKEVFLDEYSKDIYPLVSILIPTHNRPGYFKQALESAVNQTYRNIEVIVSDDSDDEITKELIKPYLEKYKNIKYFFKKGMSATENAKKCIEMADGEYGNWLMDDDLFHIEKIEMMMKYYIEYGDEISLVTSYRRLIDAYGNDLKDSKSTIKLFDKDTILNGHILGEYILKNMLNCIGEPTTVLLRMKELKRNVIEELDIKIRGLGDVTKWLKLMEKGKIVYISEALSCFRTHEEQAQMNPRVIVACTSDWVKLLMYYYNKGYYIENKKQLFTSLQKWLVMAADNMSIIKFNDKINEEYVNELREEIVKTVDIILNQAKELSN